MALYGVFHLADHPMFLGIAVYMALTSCASPRLRGLRMPILSTGVCASLMWAAVEKWAYPQWTFPLLEARPHLTLGLPPADFMVVAGFVEFALAFHILTGLGLLRLGILGLGLIFVSAILDFGRLDAIGHLPTIVALAAMLVHGPTPLHRGLHDPRLGPRSPRRAGRSSPSPPRSACSLRPTTACSTRNTGAEPARTGTPRSRRRARSAEEPGARVPPAAAATAEDHAPCRRAAHPASSSTSSPRPRPWPPEPAW